MFDDNDISSGPNTFVDIATGIERPHSLNNLLLELLAVQGALLRGLDEQGGKRSAVSNDNALANEFTTCSANTVLD